jgi:hypothetical protein
VPDFRISAIDAAWYGTEAMTKSGWAARISADCELQESFTMSREPSLTSAQTAWQ